MNSPGLLWVFPEDDIDLMCQGRQITTREIRNFALQREQKPESAEHQYLLPPRTGGFHLAQSPMD